MDGAGGECDGMIVKRWLLCAALAGVLCGGCAHQSPLVGTWIGSIDLPGGMGSVPVSIIYRADGTFTTTEGPDTGASGSYTLDGGKITETFGSIISEGKAHAIPPNTPYTQTGTFAVHGDILTLTIGEDSPPATLHRQKS